MSDIHYIDTHAHILSSEFEEDFEDVLKRAKDNHVDEIMIITLSNEVTKKAMAFAETDPSRYYVAAGIFPTDTENTSEEYWSEFEELVKDPRVTCIGEIGLDYYWQKEERQHEIQKEAFIRQIEIAKRVEKPFLVHSRDAIQDTYDIMKEHHYRGLMHCYSSSKEMAIEFTKLGYYIALGGVLTFKNAKQAVEVCEAIDENYLLSETDCPYMSPVPHRGERNEPSNIPFIVEKMAEVRNTSVEHIANCIENNWHRFLGKEDEKN